MVALIYILYSVAKSFPFLYILANICYLLSFIMPSEDVRWYLIVVNKMPFDKVQKPTRLIHILLKYIFSANSLTRR